MFNLDTFPPIEWSSLIFRLRMFWSSTNFMKSCRRSAILTFRPDSTIISKILNTVNLVSVIFLFTKKPSIFAYKKINWSMKLIETNQLMLVYTYHCQFWNYTQGNDEFSTWQSSGQISKSLCPVQHSWWFLSICPGTYLNHKFTNVIDINLLLDKANSSGKISILVSILSIFHPVIDSKVGHSRIHSKSKNYWK